MTLVNAFLLTFAIFFRPSTNDVSRYHRKLISICDHAIDDVVQQRQRIHARAETTNRMCDVRVRLKADEVVDSTNGDQERIRQVSRPLDERRRQ